MSTFRIAAGKWLFGAIVGGCLLAAPQSAAQTPTAWQIMNDGDPPPQTNSSPMLAFDSVRGRAVLVRTLSDGPTITWELDSEDWVRKKGSGPTSNTACAAYDPNRGVVVIFGGWDGLYLDETWEYDGVSWSQTATAMKPPARNGCGMVYDPDQQRIRLFGGFRAIGNLGLADTWEYDGVTWVEVDTRDTPSLRGGMGVTYDPVRQETIVFGGLNGGQLFGDTWVYDGRNWRERSASPAPSARQFPGLAFDPGLGKAVLFGGNAISGDMSDTWTWDGRDWVELTPGQFPSSRWAKLVYDTVRQAVLLHGGSGNNDTWAFDGSTWSEVAVSGLPANRYRHALAYDRSRQVAVLYGGFRSSNFFRDTWHLTESGWTLQQGLTTPTASNSFGLAYDPSTQEVVGFSGWAEEFLHVPEVHHYHGDPPDWLSLPVATPLPRQLHGWAYAQPMGGFVLFGGSACCVVGSTYLDDELWIYSGSNWSQLNPPSRPEPRNDFSMSFDTGSGNLILYGGMVSASTIDASDDTWLYDGTTWSHYLDGSPPGQRFGHRTAYDESRNVTVLFGGASNNQEGVTWEFDGVSWTARPTPFQPETGRRWSPLIYDSDRQVVLLFGGESGYHYNDTWAYGADPDGDGFVGLLDNCVDTANPAQLDGDGDTAGDLCDCALSDPGAFGVPEGTGNLVMSGDEVNWDDQAPVVGSGVTYDLVSGSVSELQSTGDFTLAACLVPNHPVSSYTDNRVPAAGDGFYYLVRSSNVCGTGTYGTNRSGLDIGSPCP